MKSSYRIRGRTVAVDTCDGASTTATALTATVSASRMMMTEEQISTNPQKMINRQASTRVKRDITINIPTRYFNGTFSSFLVLSVALFIQCGSLLLFCYRWLVVLNTDTYQNDSFAQEYFFLILSVIGTSAGFLCGKSPASVLINSSPCMVLSLTVIFSLYLVYSVYCVGNLVQI